MPRFPFSNVLFLNLRREYTVAAERNVASGIRKVAESPSKGVEKDIFWMRDPKTGNWIPENHFNTIDAAELRDKFLPTTKLAKAKAY
ncbi:hypothetical protein HAX54_025491 [Datura stramonium]|uniref:Uncharacterized protein n=1 Tax=Datura stramonium TaxID=4076 RepID=A0ABS8UZL8_DATST|nr:hypothetical protein [Datura stramonium]